MKTSCETILFSVIGMTPAVLTETVWALSRRKPAIVPDRVVVLTTIEGRERIRNELLRAGQWDALRKALKVRSGLDFGDTGRHLVVFSHQGRELPDIRTAEENLAAGDCIVEELRKFTSDPTKRVIASMAGGRKTMGALLYAAMTLVGRGNDLITHVLVHEQLERRRPPFYFPTTASEGKAIELADIPFVPLSNRFRELGEQPGGFRALVAHYSKSLAQTGPAVVQRTPRGIRVNDTTIDLSERLQVTFAFILDLNRTDDIPRQADAEDLFRAFLERHDPAWAKVVIFPDDLKRALSEIRAHMQKAGLTWMPGLRADSLRLPPFRLLS